MKTWKQTKEPTITSATTHVCRLVYRVLCLGQALDHFMTTLWHRCGIDMQLCI